MRRTQECEVGGRFSRCHNVAERTCQYCGRKFCQVHTYHAVDHNEVCTRPRCVAKYEDLLVHTAYTARVFQRNNAGLCGIEDCGPHPGFECSLCKGHFCGEHLTDRMYPFSEGWVSIDRPVSICACCWERRKIWRRR